MTRFRSYMKDFGFATVCAILLALMSISDARAQNTLTFTAGATSGTETVVPILTWDTSPLADDCIASGDWSGNKGGAGTETLAAITSGATYNLTCEWSEDTVTLTWTPPTQNTNGTPYTDPNGYKIHYGQTDGGPYTIIEDIDNDLVTTFVISPLTPGDWFFVATAYNQLDIESDFSGQVMKTMGLASTQESIGITVNPKPAVVTGLTIQ